MKLLMAADVDKSGYVDIKELMAVIVDTNSVIAKDHIKETFEKFDINNSGYLDHTEI